MKQAIVGVVSGTLMAICILIYALFQGCFDHSEFKIEAVEMSPSHRVAAVIKKSSNQALGGNEYFVLIGARTLNVKEAKRAYYNKQAVFATNQNCLSIRWLEPSLLKIACNIHRIGSDQIDIKKENAGDVQIVYENVGKK